MSHRPISLHTKFPVILHHSPRTWFGFDIAAYFNLWCREMFRFECQQYVYVACCRLYYFYMSLIYGEYLVNVYFGNIPHSFIAHFTLHSAEKICIEFSASYPLTTFRIPQNGLGCFRYMMVSVQRGGQFRYMTTSVHMRSFSVHVFFVVRLRYMWSTISVSRYRYIASCLFMLKVCKCWMDVWSVMLNFLMCNCTFFSSVDIKHWYWSPPADHRPNQRQQKLNKHVTSVVQVYVGLSDVSWKGAARLPHRSAHCEC